MEQKNEKKDRSVGPHCPPDEWWRGYLTSWNRNTIGDIPLDAVEIGNVQELVTEAQRRGEVKAWREIREVLVKNGFMTIEYDDEHEVAREKLACANLTNELILLVDSKLNSLDK